MNLAIPETELSAKSPSSVLRPMIRELSAQLSGGMAAESAKRDVGRAAYDLAAADYVAASDVQLTALLQRIWLRLFALEIGRRTPDRSTDAASLLSDLEKKDRNAEHILVQLRDGQAAILRMWLLAGKRS
jgi:hypothetical protein